MRNKATYSSNIIFRNLLVPLLFVLLFLPFLVSAEFPKPINYVSDFANVINDSEEIVINLLAEQIEKNTTAQIFVATVQNTNPYTAKEYATKIFNEWKIGQKGVDNGILILIAFEPEREWQVETGYGVEGILPDSKVGSLMREYLVPDIKEGNYGDGLFKAVAVLGAVASGEVDINTLNLQQRELDPETIIEFIYLFLLIFFMNLMLLVNSLGAGKAAVISLLPAFLVFIAFFYVDFLMFLLLWFVNFIIVFIVSSYSFEKPTQFCPKCKRKMKRVETVVKGDYIVTSFVCKNCGEKKEVKEKKENRRVWHGVIVSSGGGGYWGGSGGGFGGGGGGSGGGGAGGKF